MFLLLCACLLLRCASAASEELSDSNIRSYKLEVLPSVVPLVKSLPSSTSIYHRWPPLPLKTELPNYLSVAAIVNKNAANSLQAPIATLIGPAIHVQLGDVLQAELVNNLPATGLTLHWHGFEMTNALAYDGVAGVTQCAVSPDHTFVYKFRVEETPGTYWYHTHSGTLGLNAYNAIRGPLIVHPAGPEAKALVDLLNKDENDALEEVASKSPDPLEEETSDWGDNDDMGQVAQTSWSPMSYRDERILFLSDGFLSSDANHYWKKIGGLLAPPSKNDDGFVLGTSPWEFGTMNGKLREVVTVQPNQAYKFRLLNGGQFYAFRFSIDYAHDGNDNASSFPLTVIATDSEPVQPYTVEEVILHAAERMDVLVTIPPDVPVGSSFWIRADTLESTQQGFQNGIRGILNVVAGEEENYYDLPPNGVEEVDHNNDPFSLFVADPSQPIESSATRIQERLTLNCYSRYEKENAKKDGGCLPITELIYDRSNTLVGNRSDVVPTNRNNDAVTEFHTVDFEFQNYPQHSHFVRTDGGPYLQHVNPHIPMVSPDFDPAKHLHPHTAILNVEAYSTAIIVWRSKSQVDHPIHLHGLKMEILEIVAADKERDCTMAKCRLSEKLFSEEARKRLENTPFSKAPLKDTFVLPAGGTVAIRIPNTGKPAVWLGHCHIHVHLDDGMAFVLNVGNFIHGDARNEDTSLVLTDHPSCHTPFLLTQQPYPACPCYINENAVLDASLTEEHYCSRHHLCFYQQAPIAHLESYPNDVGVEIRSNFPFPNWLVSLCLVAMIAICGTCLLLFKRGQSGITGTFRRRASSFTIIAKGRDQNRSLRLGKRALGDETEQDMSSTARFDRDESDISANDDDFPSTATQVQQASPSRTWDQFKSLVASDWKDYRPTCINLLRLVEVTGLAVITGLLFFEVGTNNSSTGLGEKTSLLFFSTTLWTFTRMYPAVGSYFSWKKRVLNLLRDGDHDLIPVCLSRLVVVVAAESAWPFIYTFVCYPLASLAGDVSVLFKIALLLCLNNLCYISIGSVLGTTSRSIPLGMIASTITSQTSLVAAGFYTTLPPFIKAIRLVSPVFWTFSGIVKSVYRWSDTYDCVKGQSDAGPTQQCYIETNPGIDNLKTRGINVATFGDPRSNNTTSQFLMLVLLYTLMQMGVAFSVMLSFWRRQRWHARFELLKQYQEEYGTCHVPCNHTVIPSRIPQEPNDEDNVVKRVRVDSFLLRVTCCCWRRKEEGPFALGLWVERQRRNLSKKRLSEHQVALLDSIGFRSSPPLLQREGPISKPQPSGSPADSTLSSSSEVIYLSN